MEKEPIHSQPNGVWLVWGLWIVALGGLLYLAGLTAWLGLTGLAFPYQLDYGEGPLLHFVKEWARGNPIYKSIEGYPYITSNYAPLTIALALALTPFLGVSYAAGRIWTLLAIVAITAIIVAWVQREGRRRLAAVVAALLFVGSPYVYHWAPLFRVDLVGLALTLSGLYTVNLLAWRSWSTEQRKSRWPFWLAIVLFVAGLYAKQSFLFAPAAALVYLFFFVDRGQAIKMAAAMGILGGGLFVLINLLTGGGFWESLVVSNVNPFLWPEFWKQQADFFGTFALLGLLTAWYVVDKFVLDRNAPLREKINPLDLYLPAALASLLLAGKAGAWENYFFEALVALALCGGLGLARLMSSGNAAHKLLAPLLVLVQVGLMWHTPRVAERYLALTQQSNKEMAPILANMPDPIISEDMGLLVTNDKTLDYFSFQYSQLARAGRWDQAWELDQLRNRRLSAVILKEGTRLDVDRYQRFTREFLSELDRNYRQARTAGKYVLYEPDPLQHEADIGFGGQLALVGWSLHTPPKVQAGETLSLTVVWQAQGPLTIDYTAFAHLVDEKGQGWAQDDHAPHEGLYPTSAWGAGEMVRDIFVLTIPPDAPPGLYDVRVGWYDPLTQNRLPVGDGDSVRVAVVPVDWTSVSPEPLTPLNARFGDAITLVGHSRRVEPGGVQATLRWSAAAFLDADYSVFVHLVDAEDNEKVLAQGDSPPLEGRWPTSLWLPGVVLDDTHTVQLPPGLPPGAYRLLVGLYNPTTFERLSLPDGTDAVDLGVIQLP